MYTFLYPDKRILPDTSIFYMKIKQFFLMYILCYNYNYAISTIMI